MAEYYVVTNEQSQGERFPLGTEWEGSKNLDNCKQARVLKVEAASVLAAQQYAQHVLGGSATNPVAVLAAQWKEA